MASPRRKESAVISGQSSVLVGDCREVLKTLAAESVQAVVTSPPYWGLRSYGTEPLVWPGPDAPGDCEHEWGDELPAAKESHTGEGGKHGAFHGGIDPREYRGATAGQFCRKCSAWRGDLGLEPTPELYCFHLLEVFDEVRRVLRKDGTLWLNMGDCYAGSPPRVAYGDQADNSVAEDNRNWMRPKVAGLKPKDLLGMPWRVVFALQLDGWWLRSAIVWAKPNPMPESVTDRPTSSYELVFLLAKSTRYFYDADAVREGGKRESAERYRYAFSGAPDGRIDPGGHERICPEGMRCYNGTRNLRNVWTIPTQPFPEAHFATFPEALAERCIKAGTSEKGCCPECGAAWERIVESSPMETIASGKREGYGNRTYCSGMMTKPPESRTIGWQPGCGCNFETPDLVRLPYRAEPCLVLDPFAGAGTVGVACHNLGRRFIGIELSPEYAEMARKRIAKAENPATFRDVDKVGDAPLFVQEPSDEA